MLSLEYYVFYVFFSLPLLVIILVYGAAFNKLMRNRDSSDFPISNRQVLLQLSSFTIYVVAQLTYWFTTTYFYVIWYVKNSLVFISNLLLILVLIRIAMLQFENQRD